MILFTAVRLSNKPPAKNDTGALERLNGESWTFADRERIQIELFRRDIEIVKMKTCAHRRVRVVEEI